MHYASLASGSKGNAHVLGGEGRLLLVDAGISFLQIRRRLEALQTFRHAGNPCRRGQFDNSKSADCVPGIASRRCKGREGVGQRQGGPNRAFNTGL